MQNYEEITYANECCPIDNCTEDKNTIGLYEEVENAYDVDAPNDNSIENICNTIEKNDKPLAKSISLELKLKLDQSPVVEVPKVELASEQVVEVPKVELASEQVVEEPKVEIIVEPEPAIESIVEPVIEKSKWKRFFKFFGF